jgi:hypothetical protein
MTFPELLTRVDRAYREESGGILNLSKYFNLETGENIAVDPCEGDTLALFIGLELHDTFSPEQDDSTQLFVARTQIEIAADQLTKVAQLLR